MGNALNLTVESSAPPWTAVIQPRRRLWDLRLAELWRSRDLIALLVRRDFFAAYKQTLLGPLWHLIQPVLTTLTFTIVFGRIAGLSTDGLPAFLFYLSGTVLWSYFATCFTRTANIFVANADLYSKVYFHRLAIPISVVISSMVSFIIQLALFLVCLVFFLANGANVTPNWSLALLPLLLLLMAGFGLGFGIVVSALTTRYRDLVQLVSFGVHLLMYATPVIYPVSSVPAKYQTLLALNPLAPVIEAFRFGFLGAGTLSAQGLAYSALVLVAVLLTGLMLFNRVERTFADTV